MADAVPTEAQPQPENIEGKKFTQEQQDSLLESFEIFSLTGRTYQEIVEKHPSLRFSRDFARYGKGTGGDEMVDHLEGLRSQNIEVAIPKHDSIFIDKSDGRTSEEQQRMIEESSRAKEVPGVKRVMGGTLDYVELAAQYADSHNGASLFGSWTDRKQATAKDGFYVGSMPKQGQESAEITISHRRGGPNNEGPWAAALIVPA